MDTALKVGMFIGAFLLVCGFIFGMWWLAKHGSYFLWYEDMVQGTIREMVKPESLLTTK